MSVSVKEFEGRVLAVEGVRIVFRSISAVPEQYRYSTGLLDTELVSDLGKRITQFAPYHPFVIIGGTGLVPNQRMQMVKLRASYRPIKSKKVPAQLVSKKKHVWDSDTPVPAIPAAKAPRKKIQVVVRKKS